MSRTRDSEQGLEGVPTLESLRQAFARLPAQELGVGEARGPFGLAVAVTRETGSRGGTIARRVGKKLGWQVYNQELLEYLAQERHLGRELFEGLDANALAWIETQLQSLLRARNLSGASAMADVARVVLAIGVRGQAVILGRGAGCILPPRSTLHVRVIAPLAERTAYMAQFERLTPERAAEQVRLRDEQRALFVQTHFHRNPSDVHQYDLVVNSSLLGEELAAELIARAALDKQAALECAREEPDFAG